LTPGAKLFAKGEFCPLEVKLSPGGEISVRPSILLNSREYSPLGMNEGVNIPLGDKFHPWGTGVKLRVALSLSHVGASLSCAMLIGFDTEI
jgi:hypothetical protein